MPQGLRLKLVGGVALGWHLHLLGASSHGSYSPLSVPARQEDVLFPWHIYYTRDDSIFFLTADAVRFGQRMRKTAQPAGPQELTV